MAQNLETPLATSLLHFEPNKLYKNKVCILALLGLATVLATFQKVLGNCFPNHLVTLNPSKAVFALAKFFVKSPMTSKVYRIHRNHSVHIERGNMHRKAFHSLNNFAWV